MTSLLLQGFSLEWMARPHRMRAIGAGCDAVAELAPPRGGVSAHLEGGSWASGERAFDRYGFDLACAGLDRAAPVVRVATTVTLTGTYPEHPSGRHAASAQVPMRVPLPPGVAWSDVAVWLSSFDLHADTGHPDGFTLHSLEVRLGQPEVAGGSASVLVRVEVEAAAVPDRPERLITYGAEVSLGVVFAPSFVENVRRTTTTAAERHGLRFDERAPPAQRTEVMVQLPTAAPGAVAGLSGFRMAVEEAGYTEGRYLRALAAEVEDLRYDPWTGRATADVTQAFSNAGFVTRAFAATMEADVTFLALASGDSAWGSRWRGEAAGPTWSLPYPAR